MIYYAYDLNHSYLHALKHAYIPCANIMRAPSSMLPGCSSKFLVNQTLRRLTSTTESCHCPQRCALSEGIGWCCRLYNKPQPQIAQLYVWKIYEHIWMYDCRLYHYTTMNIYHLGKSSKHISTIFDASCRRWYTDHPLWVPWLTTSAPSFKEFTSLPRSSRSFSPASASISWWAGKWTRWTWIGGFNGNCVLNELMTFIGWC